MRLFYTVSGGLDFQLFEKIREPFIRRMPTPTHCISITTKIQTKVRACAAHRSQKLMQSKPVPLAVWYALFDKEYYHLVDFNDDYRFILAPFRTKYFKFNPKKEQKL
jgi:hypothetical protein